MSQLEHRAIHWNWALLSPQGTFLVAFVRVRDVLGWGASEVIGRSICAMVRDSRSGIREHVEAGLAKLDTLEVCLPLPFSILVI